MTKEHMAMKRFSLAAKARALFGICGFVAVCLFATLAFAHGGEDHGNDGAAKGESSVAARLAASSAQYEIVGVPTGQSGGKLTLYVTDFLSNKPVANAAIDVAVNDTTERAKVSGNHYELAAPWVKTPGNYALTFSVTAGESSDLLIATLEIPAAAVQEVHETVWDHIIPHDGKAPSGLLITISAFAALLLLAAVLARGLLRRFALLGFALAATAAAGTAALGLAKHAHDQAGMASVIDLPQPARRTADGGVFMPKAAQALLGIETIIVQEEESAQKTVSLAGQIISDPNKSGVVQALLAGRLEAPDGGFPAIGSPVKKGDVLGYLVPRVERVDQSDIAQTTGDLDRQIKLAEAKVARFDKLKNVIAEAQITDARLELDGLRERRAAIRPVLAEREALIAPASGVIALSNVAAGQVVDTQATLFQIIDPESLFVEALAFDTKVASEVDQAAKDAVATTSDGQKLTLAFAGRGLSMRQQATPLRYRITGGGNGLSLGQPVTVSIPVEEPVKAIPVPRASLVRAPNGQQSVLVHVAPERFEARPVASETVGGDQIGITAGLDSQARVVVRGAELINQVR